MITSLADPPHSYSYEGHSTAPFPPKHHMRKIKELCESQWYLTMRFYGRWDHELVLKVSPIERSYSGWTEAGRPLAIARSYGRWDTNSVEESPGNAATRWEVYESSVLIPCF